MLPGGGEPVRDGAVYTEAMTPPPGDAARIPGKAAPPPPIAGDFMLEGRLVQPDVNRIVVDGSFVTVEPKIMQVLARLAASPGRLVTKEELFDAAWSGTFVTDDVLTRAIAELRKIFADDPANPKIIETIRKKGYRLLVDPLPPPSPTPEVRPPAAAFALQRSGSARAAWGLVVALALAAAAAIVLRRPAASKRVRILPVTTFPGNEVRPALSPDGTRVAFTWERPGEKPGLWVKLIDAATPLRLTEAPGADRYPAWSPDGQQIVFSRLSEGRCTLSVVAAIGGAVRSLADCGTGDGVHPSWSPDGSSMALAAREPNGQWRIELFDVARGTRRPVTAPPPGIDGDSEPAFSPDGRSIAFVRTQTDGVDDLYVVAPAGGEPRRMTFENRALTGADWAPDGKSLVFSSSRAGLFSLWRLPLSGGEPQLVGGGGSKMKHPSAARARNAIAYENWNYEVNLWSVPLRGAAARPTRVTFAADEWEFDPEFSPDGSRVAYVSTKTGAPEIWTTTGGGGEPVQLTRLGGPQVSTPRWSPDGRTIVFSARPEGQADLYLVPSGGGLARRLTHDPGDEIAPSFSSDGLSIYFASRRSGAWQIWKMPAAGGAAVMLTRDGGATPFPSRDGHSLYYTKTGAPGLWRSGADGGPEERVSDAILPANANDWRLTGRGIYYRDPHARDTSVVLFRPFDGDVASRVAELDEQAWAGFSVAPDDSALVYGRADRRDCDIRMIENPF